MENLRGKLLISSGGLFDSNFRHTVILVGEHGEEGAVGVVLNRRTDVTVEQAVPPLAALVEAGDHLYEGGPVEPAQPVLLAELTTPALVDVPIFGAIGFMTGDVSTDVRSVILRARVFAGHAGWGPGQLESELAEKTWIVADATDDDVFTRTPNSLWNDVLRRMGPPYSTMARIPFDPTTN